MSPQRPTPRRPTAQRPTPQRPTPQGPTSSGPPPRGPAGRRRLDVVALVFGLVLTGTAATCLWLSLVGSVNWSLLKTVAPLSLVVVGVIGLALSRRSP